MRDVPELSQLVFLDGPRKIRMVHERRQNPAVGEENRLRTLHMAAGAAKQDGAPLPIPRLTVIMTDDRLDSLIIAAPAAICRA